MKSAIVGKSFVTSVTDITTLTRGQVALVDQTGAIATAGAKMVQFVVGLGDGQVKRGVWLNPKNMSVVAEAYAAPVPKTVVFTNLVANRGIGYQGTDAEIIISIKPLNSFGGYPLEVYNASVTMLDSAETSSAILTRLNDEIKKVVAKINARFGANTITATELTTNTVTFTGKAGVEFYVTTDGILRGTKTETLAKLPVGTYEQVSALEKEYDVAASGYNPNYLEYEKMYGDIFIAEKGKTYGVCTVVSAAPHTHPFHMHTEGLDVTQFVAIEGTTAAAVKEALDALVAPDNTDDTNDVSEGEE